MLARNFSTEAHSIADRRGLWDDELRAFGVVPQFPGNESLFYASLVCSLSPSGLRFGRIASAGPQVLTCSLEPSGGFWFARLLEGEATLSSGVETLRLQVGEIAYGMLGDRAQLTFKSEFRLLLIKAPASLLSPRLLVPLSLKAGRFATPSGSRHVLSNMLSAVVDKIEMLSADDLRALEVALPEFFFVNLIDSVEKGGADSAGSRLTAQMLRLCQAIEANLTDPELSLGGVARQQGMSQRAVQKLFESVGSRFSLYVKQRRLERCRADLGNPLYAHLSISAIAYHWGFNEAAHFSRTFRQTFGVSPRDFRNAATEARPDAETPHPVRGLPDGVKLSRGAVVNFAAAARRRTEATQDGPVAKTAGTLRRLFDKTGRKFHLPVNDKTVHWGYFSRFLTPVLEVASGDTVTIEALTQHAYDDYGRMIQNDDGAERVFHWTKDRKAVVRRGAGPLEATVHGRGPGEGFGVHICTGPVAIRDAMPGDVLEVQVVDIAPRPSANPEFKGRIFGSNAAAWWGFHYNDLITEPHKREVVTIYEISGAKGRECAHAVYSYRWTPQRDPSGVLHPTIDYPGIPVDHATIEKQYGVLKDVRIPVRPHFGTIGLAPDTSDIVDSVPPSSFGGNLDNWRLGAGSRIYLPVAVAGGLFSVGDPHASQGDGELCGTAIECSLTGTFRFVLHKKNNSSSAVVRDLDYPLIETDTEWVIQGLSHPNYLSEFGQNAQSEIYKHSSLDLAMRDAFRKTRRFLMTAYGLSEDETISLMSVGIDFGVTQVANGNWGIHAIIRKQMFQK